MVRIVRISGQEARTRDVLPTGGGRATGAWQCSAANLTQLINRAPASARRSRVAIPNTRRAYVCTACSQLHIATGRLPTFARRIAHLRARMRLQQQRSLRRLRKIKAVQHVAGRCVARRQRLQAVTRFDELQNRRVIIHSVRDIPCLSVRRNDQQRHTRA